jgi:hypothetical protein
MISLEKWVFSRNRGKETEMKKSLIIICVTFFVFTSVVHAESKDNLKMDEKETLESGVGKEKAIEIAKGYILQQGWDLKIYQEPVITLDKTNKAWSIFFQTIDPIPGGHFELTIDCKTGEILHIARGK